MKIEKWIVREHVDGVPDVERIYEKVVEEVDIQLKDDEMLFRTMYIGVDLYLQGICLDTPIGDHMGGDSILQVLAAGPTARFKVGDVVHGFGGWRSHLVSNGEASLWQTGTFPMVFPAYRRLNLADYDERLPISTALSVMGGPGMTAWGTLNKFMTIHPGQTILISGATGTIGTLVGQLAKRAGAHVVGTTGSPEKAQYLRDLGFDEVITYRQGDEGEHLREALLKAAPGGIDRYFDNLGGAVTDLAFSMLNIDSQVAVCWQWATQVGQDYVGPRLLPYIMFPRATIRGIFAIEWFTDENFAALHDQLGDLIRRGEIGYRHTVRHGFDEIPNAYQSLFLDRDANRGKMLIEL